MEHTTKARVPRISRLSVVTVAPTALLLFSCGALPEDGFSENEVVTVHESIVGTPVTTDVWGIPNFNGGCGSVVLSDYWVLTARHCGPSPYIRQGWVRMRQDGVQRTVSRGLQHPKQDAALLRLAKPARIPGSYIYKNGLYRGTLASLEGKPVTCFGWGPNDSSGSGGGVLRMATGKITDTYWTDQWGDQFKTNITTFGGDSGGPCFVDDGGQTVVAGVLMSGSGYASVTGFRDWAENLMTGDLASTDVIVAADWGITGQSTVLHPGSYPTAASMWFPDGAASSFRSGAMTAFTLYDGTNFGTPSYSAARGGDVWDLQGVGFNDKMSSAKVDKRPDTGCPDPGPNQVTLWEHANYTGRCDVLRPTSLDEMGALNVGNGLTSVKVGSNVQIRLYNTEGFAGGWVNLSSNVADLTSQSMNDQTRSLRINGRNCAAPGDLGVVLWSDAEYLGTCKTHSLGKFSYSANGFNNAASSVQVGRKTRLALYDGIYAGTGTFLRSDHPFLQALDMNDRTSSVKVKRQEQCSDPAYGEAVLYEHSNYNQGSTTAKCVTLAYGSYATPLNSEFDIGNDVVSSFKLGGGTKLTLCNDDYFYPKCKTFTSSVSDLTTVSYPNNGNWNDKASSVKVESN
jgi:hypothetical protein